MQELITHSEHLYDEIYKCIGNLLESRKYHDEIQEQGAILKMEQLLCNTMQHLRYTIDKVKYVTESEKQECAHDWQFEGEDRSRGMDFLRSLYTCRKCGKQKWFKG